MKKVSLLLLPLLFICSFVFAQTEGMVGDSNFTETTLNESDTTYSIVEQIPTFPGGSDGLIKYISESLKYPKSDVKAWNEGLVAIKFVVEKNGIISRIEVVHKSGEVSTEMEQEALRVVREMPNWEPGIQKGQLVRVAYTLPIRFKLRK